MTLRFGKAWCVRDEKECWRSQGGWKLNFTQIYFHFLFSLGLRRRVCVWSFLVILLKPIFVNLLKDIVGNNFKRIHYAVFMYRMYVANIPIPIRKRMDMLFSRWNTFLLKINDSTFFLADIFRALHANVFALPWLVVLESLFSARVIDEYWLTMRVSRGNKRGWIEWFPYFFLQERTSYALIVHFMAEERPGELDVEFRRKNVKRTMFWGRHFVVHYIPVKKNWNLDNERSFRSA